MNAAGHRWMGKPLSAYPDQELWWVLATLEAVRYGASAPRRNVDRDEIIDAVAEIDTDLARIRAGGARKAVAAVRDEGRIAA